MDEEVKRRAVHRPSRKPLASRIKAPEHMEVTRQATSARCLTQSTSEPSRNAALTPCPPRMIKVSSGGSAAGKGSGQSSRR
jgi:hypothetical protein